MTTDFEYKLKEQLSNDIESTNLNVLDAVMKTPFKETRKVGSFLNLPKRAVATLCASVLLLCVGVFATDHNIDKGENVPMPMMASEMHRTMESDELNVSEALSAVLLETEMDGTLNVAVLSPYNKTDFIKLSNLGREITKDDLTALTAGNQEVIMVEIEKSSIINMKDYFYFMLPSEA